MKVLIDCVPIVSGGGIQVAVAVLDGLSRHTAVEWNAVVPTAMRAALPAGIAADPRMIYVERKSAASRLWLAGRLRRIERELAPDVTFTVFGPPFFRPRSPHLAGFALPHLLYDPDALVPRVTSRAGDRLRCAVFRRADHLVVETGTARLRLSQRLGIPLSRISVIPNSFNPLLKRVADIDPTDERCFTVLVPSAYYAHKNLELVPEVAAEMRRRDLSLKFVFRLTLDPASPQWRAFAAKAQALGASSHVTTLGVLKVTELSAAYADASAVYLPTLREVSSAVYPESFFFRRPLVTTDMDFARELCGAAALFATPSDPGAAADCLAGLARSAELRNRLIEAGEQQLSAVYPTPAQKLGMQLKLLAQLSATCAGEDRGRDHAEKRG